MSKPGRDLDFAVAELLPPQDPPVPKYSTDISASWKLAEILHDLWYAVAIINLRNETLVKVYKMPAMEECVRVKGDTAPHAIALAALKVLGDK